MSRCYKSGIDVSKWQGKIDWQKAKQDGVEFAILRIYDRTKNNVDERFEENYAACVANQIPVGVYYYSMAQSIESAKNEAETTLYFLHGKRLEYPIYFDIEDNTILQNTDLKTRNQICESYLEKIKNFGGYGGIYCNSNWYKNNLSGNELALKYNFWIAAYNRIWSLIPGNAIKIWQRSQTGKVDGINGDVDLDECYFDYPTFLSEKKLNNF